MRYMSKGLEESIDDTEVSSSILGMHKSKFIGGKDPGLDK